MITYIIWCTNPGDSKVTGMERRSLNMGRWLKRFITNAPISPARP